MPSTTVRLRDKTRKAPKEIAAATGTSMQEAPEQAIEQRRRQLYLEGLNADYAALRRDPKAWDDFQNENVLWDGTNADGLEGL